MPVKIAANKIRAHASTNHRRPLDRSRSSVFIF